MISRRKAIQLCGGVAGSILLSGVACSPDNSILSPLKSNELDSSPNPLSRFSAEQLGEAQFLASEYYSKCLNGEVINNPFLFGNRVMIAKESSAIMIIDNVIFHKIAVSRNKVYVIMRVIYFGIIRGLVFYHYAPKEGYSKNILVKHEIVNDASVVRLRECLPLILSPQAAILHYGKMMNQSRKALALGTLGIYGQEIVNELGILLNQIANLQK